MRALPYAKARAAMPLIPEVLARGESECDVQKAAAFVRDEEAAADAVAVLWRIWKACVEPRGTREAQWFAEVVAEIAEALDAVEGAIAESAKALLTLL
jgi:hypothetical protein